ncbi:hypothetical protein SB778_30795 [Paraburkholderia sp. SIMBA_050]
MSLNPAGLSSLQSPCQAGQAGTHDKPVEGLDDRNMVRPSLP